MDEIARRYLLLGLRLGRLVPGFVDSYVGPEGLRAEADAGAPPDPAGLRHEAEELRELAAALPGDDPATVRRRTWFDGQLRSIATHAGAVARDEPPYVELVEALLDVRVVEYGEAALLRMRARLENALPGTAPLAERLAAFRTSLHVPADRVLAALQSSAARLRDATRRDFGLPAEEAIDWDEAHGEPWGAYAEFLGSGRTAIRVNVDLPRDLTYVPFLAAHEAYPGHHAEHVTKERTLIGGGLGEAALRTMNTPESVLSEGQAEIAREVVMGDWELEDELRRLGREVGVAGDWAAAVAVSNATLSLEAAMCDAALMVHRDGRSDDEVRDFLREMTPQPPERLEHAIRALHDPTNRTYEFTYVEGSRLIRPWLELQGQTAGFARLLSEQLSPAVLRAELVAGGVEADASAPPR